MNASLLKTPTGQRLSALLAFCILHFAFIKAQPIQVNVALAPPYPVHWEDYAQFKGQTVVTLINTGQASHSVRLVPTVTGVANGVSATLRPGYRPSVPIQIGPMETRILTGAQLMNLHGNLSIDDLDIKGIDLQQVVQTETVPEGFYTLCVRAFDFNGTAQLSPDGTGCTSFQITWYDPPFVVSPMNNGPPVQPMTPQFLNIAWTPSGMPGKTRYRLEMVDLTASGLNENDAFNYGQPLFFEKENLMMTAFPFGPADPPLTAGHRYALRVRAYDPMGQILFKNDGWSAVSTFLYQNGNPFGSPGGPGGGVVVVPPNNNPNNNNQQNDPPQPPLGLNDPIPNPAAGGCIGTTAAPLPNDKLLAANIPGNADFIIGLFVVKNVAMSFNGNGYSGTGSVMVNWLKTPVKVSFSNLKMNKSRQVFEGKLTGDLDAPGLYDAAILNSKDGAIDLPQAKMEEISSKIAEADRLVSKMNGSQPIGLPLGFDNANQNFGIAGLIFEPTGAWMNGLMGMEMPDAFAGGHLSFTKKGVAIHPNGFGEEVKVSLVKDATAKLSNYADLKFLKGENSTFISLDCGGFKNLSVAGELVFSREKVLPLDAQGKVVADVNTKLKAAFSIEAALKITDILAQATLSHDFSIPQAKDLVFKRPNGGQKTADLILDLSEAQAGEGFVQKFPQKGVAWKGVFLKGLSCKLPEPFRKNGSDVVLSVSNFMVDKQGVSGVFELQNEVVKTSEGEAAGLGISINYAKIAVENSVLTAGQIKGKAQTPISATPIGYECAVSTANSLLNFSFTVSELPGLDVEMWVAKVNIVEGSALTIAKQGQKWGAKLDVTGSIGITLNGAKEGSDLKKFEMPSLAFEHLIVNTLAGAKPNFQTGVMELDNLNLPQIKLANFDLTIGDIAVKSWPGEKYALNIPMDISLIGQQNGGQQQGDNANTIGGGTVLNFIGKYDEVKKRFVYDGIKLGLIQIEASLGPLLDLKGLIQIYQDDANYGNGFRGKLEAKAEGLKVDLKFIAQFGKKNTTRYCMVDAQVKFAPGIPIPGTAAAINGFGGGFWYNMNAGGAPPKKTASQFQNAGFDAKAVGQSNSGVNYTVSSGKIGFRAMISFCIAGSETAMNGDIEFGVQLDYDDMSLDSIGLAGNMFLMQGLNTRPNDPAAAPVHMYARIAIVPENELFHGVFGVGINIGGVLTGGGEIEIHFDGKKDKWHIYAGKWSQSMADEPWNDDDRINIGVGYELGNIASIDLTFFGYFQIGNDLQGMPPIPSLITNLFEPGKFEPKKPFSGTGDAQGNVSGIAVGLGIDFNLEINVLFFYAKLKLLIGTDILLQKINAECGDQGFDYGVNGWYAKGQAYAYLHGEAGLHLDLWFWEGHLKLLDMTAAAVLQAQLPNPVWMRGDFALKGEVLGGLVKIDTEVDFELGEKCGPAGNPFDDYPMIANTFPEPGATNVSLFADPSVAFNFKKFKRYDLTTAGGDQQEVMMQAFDADIKLEKKNKNTNKWEAVPGKLHWNAAETGATWVPTDMLAADHDFRFYAKVKGFLFDKNDKVKLSVVEDTTATFRSAKTPPDEFVWENITSTFPYPRQRFFTSPTVYYEVERGHIRLQSGQAYVFQKTPPAGVKYEYVARFINVEQNKVLDVPAFYESSGEGGKPEVQFTPPWQELSGSKIHRFDLIRKQVTTGNQPPPQSGPAVTSYQQMVQQLLVNKKKLAGQSITALKKGEKRLFSGLYFRTSKHSNLQYKLDKMTVKRTGWIERPIDETTLDGYITPSATVPVVLVNPDEAFDGYDLRGYDLGMAGVPAEPPLLRFYVPGENAWLNGVRQDLLTNLVLTAAQPFSVKPRDDFQKVIDRYWKVQSGNTPNAIYRMGTLKLFGTSPVSEAKTEFMSYEHSPQIEADLRANGDLLGNEGLMKAAPPLSTAEINSAIAKGKQAGLEAADVNIFDFKSTGNGGGGINLPNFDLAGVAADKSYFALVDHRSWLVAQDWEFTKGWIMNEMLWHYDENDQHAKVLAVRDVISAKKPSKQWAGGSFRAKLNGYYSKEFSFNFN